MARLGSSSCRPLVQGMMLLALLLLASIQAGGQEAGLGQRAGLVIDQLGHTVGNVGHKVKELVDHVPEEVRDQVEKHQDMLGNKIFNELGKKPGWKDFSDGGKFGLKIHKYGCKAQGWMDKQNPGGASGTPYLVDILGDLSKSFPTFYYSVTSGGGGNSVVVCSRSADQLQVQATGTGATLVPSRYPPTMPAVRITGIRVGLAFVKTPASYTQSAYTNLYGSLKEVVIRQINALNPGATLVTPSPPTADKLCYNAVVRLPRIAVLLASDNVMQPMELGGTTAVWYPELSISMYCLGIGRTMDLLILGRT